MTERTAIRQGFLCPVCLVDTGEPSRLEAHVLRTHPELVKAAGASGSGAADAITGLLAKAKEKIRRLDTNGAVELSGAPNASGIPAGAVTSSLTAAPTSTTTNSSTLQQRHQQKPHYAPAVSGMKRSHTTQLREWRTAAMDESALRTNMLIIRLDRLIHAAPKEAGKRRDFERSVVAWVGGEQCASCAARFSITRRKHHCRLCGKLLCANCSRALSFLLARKLTNPSLAAEMLQAQAEHHHSNQGDHESVTSSSESRIWQDAEQQLRVCASCLALLERRDQRMEQSQITPAFVSFYDTLCTRMIEIAQAAAIFSRVVNSLNAGETVYTLEQAHNLQTAFVQRQQQIKTLCDKVVAWQSGATTSNERESTMRRNIRLVALQAIQEAVGQIPSIPTREQHARMVELRRERLRMVVASNAAMTADDPGTVPSGSAASFAASPPILTHRQNAKAAGMHTSSSVPSNMTNQEGWTPSVRVADQAAQAHNPFHDDDDRDDNSERHHPLLMQRHNVQAYLEDAVKSGRVDAAESLEQNLHDLDAELRRLGLGDLIDK